jgi:hypothetical protein
MQQTHNCFNNNRSQGKCARTARNFTLDVIIPDNIYPLALVVRVRSQGKILQKNILPLQFLRSRFPRTQTGLK